MMKNSKSSPERNLAQSSNKPLMLTSLPSMPLTKWMTYRQVSNLKLKLDNAFYQMFACMRIELIKLSER